MRVRFSSLPCSTADLADAALVCGPAQHSSRRQELRRWIDGSRSVPPKWQRLCDRLLNDEDRRRFWRAVLSAIDEGPRRSEETQATTLLRDRSAWPRAFREELAALTSEASRARWVAVLDGLPTINARHRVLETVLAAYEAPATGGRWVVTVRAILDGAFRPGKGAKREAPEGEWLLLMLYFVEPPPRGLDLPATVASNLACDLLRWFTSDPPPGGPQAMSRRWYRWRRLRDEPVDPGPKSARYLE